MSACPSECGSVLIDDRGLRKQQRLHCKLARVTKLLTFACPDCDAKYESQIGLAQHRKHAHPRQYNEDGETIAANRVRPHRQWTPEERPLLARAEVHYINNPGPDTINVALSGIFGCKANAIRCQRRGREYSNFLRRAREEVERGLEVPFLWAPISYDADDRNNDPRHPPSITCPPDSPIAEEPVEDDLNTPPGSPSQLEDTTLSHALRMSLDGGATRAGLGRPISSPPRALLDLSR